MTSDGISSDGKTLTIEERLTEEVAGANITISSVGGTDLSIYPLGLDLVVKGSDSGNDGTYYVQDSSTNSLTLGIFRQHPTHSTTKYRILTRPITSLFMLPMQMPMPIPTDLLTLKSTSDLTS